MTPADAGEEFFAPDDEAIAIYRLLARCIAAIEDVEVVVSKSQVTFRARRGFAYAWAPNRYLRSEVPLVLSIALRERLTSSRFKEVAHPSRSIWMHHIELRHPQDVDQELIGWLMRSYDEAR